MGRVAGILIGGAIALVMVSGASASAATVVVRPSAMDGWAAQARDPSGTPVPLGDPYCNGSVSFVSGPATPPLGVGSAELKTGNGTTGGDCSAELRNSDYAGVKLSALTALSYSTYDVTNNGQQFPYLELYVNNNGTGTTVDDALFFEPPYQAPGAGGSACANQAATVMDAWQPWDALNGCWWDNNNVLGNGGTNTSPLSAYLAAFPNATIVNSSTGGGIHLVVGFASPTDQFDGNVDAFRIATSSSDTTYNFEPDVPTALTSQTQAMDGDLKVKQGSTLSAGYDFSMPGTHPTATAGFHGTQVTFEARCASGTPGSQTIVVSIPDASYADPANSSAWIPSGNQNDASTYQGATTVPSFCDPGALVRLQQGGTFSTGVTSTDTTNKVNVRWHYMDGTGGGWSGTYSVIPG